VLAADSPECLDGRLGLVGVSVGGTLALLVASAPELTSRVSVVSCIAPYTDLRKVMFLATTGIYPGARGLERYTVPSSLLVGLARSIVSILPPTADALALRAMTSEIGASGNGGPMSLRTQPSTPFSPPVAAVHDLLSNRDPLRFNDLYAALPAGVRETVDLLSPLRVATRLQAPIEIATAPRDKYFPLGESIALQEAAPNVRVTVTPSLAHAVPKLGLTRLGGVGRLHAFFVRSLSAACSTGPWPEPLS
jgi:pimeloyl-ACP methyl ester carboxylesterase